MGGGKGGWQGGDEKRINYWKYIQLDGQVRERDEWPSSLVLIGKKNSIMDVTSNPSTPENSTLVTQ